MLVKGIFFVLFVCIADGRNLRKTRYASTKGNAENELAFLESLLEKIQKREGEDNTAVSVEPINETPEATNPTPTGTSIAGSVASGTPDAGTISPNGTVTGGMETGSTTLSLETSTVIQETTTKVPMTEEEIMEKVQRVLDNLFVSEYEHKDSMKTIVRKLSHDILKEVITDFTLTLLDEIEYCEDKILLEVVAGGVHQFTIEESSLGDETNLRYTIETYIIDNNLSPDYFGIPVQNFTKKAADAIFKPIVDFFKLKVEPTIGSKSETLWIKIVELLRNTPTPDMELEELLREIGVVVVMNMESQHYESCDQILTPEIRLYLKEESEKADLELKSTIHAENMYTIVNDVSPHLSEQDILDFLDYLDTSSYQANKIQEMEMYLLEFESTDGSLSDTVVHVAQEAFRKFLVFEIEESLMDQLAETVRVVVEEELGKCGLYHDVPVGTVSEEQIRTIFRLAFERVLREGVEECMDTVLVRMLAGFIQYREYYVNYDFVYFTVLFEHLEVDLVAIEPKPTRLAIVVFRLVKELFADHYAKFFQDLETLAGRSSSELYFYDLERMADPKNKDMALDKYIEEIVRVSLEASEVESMDACQPGEIMYPSVVEMGTTLVDSAKSMDTAKIKSIVKHTLQIFDEDQLTEITDVVKGRLDTIFESEIHDIESYRDAIDTAGQNGLLSNIIDTTVDILAYVESEPQPKGVARRKTMNV